MRRNERPQYLFVMSILALVLSTMAVHAQNHPQPAATPAVSATPSLEKEFLKNVLRDQKAIWTAPLHLDRSDAKWMVPAGIGTMALITTDRITGDELAEFHRQIGASRDVSYAGSVYGLGAVAGTFYLVGRTRNNERARETGILSAEALVDSLIVGGALKGITQRARPSAGRERSEFFESGSSFPSGHSIQVWSVATIIAHEYHDRTLVQIAAYGVASAVSVSRFAGGKHYLSDVVVGSALGFGIGHFVYHARHRASTDKDVSISRWPAITPTFNRRERERGIAVSWSF